jgi:MFS family permease
LSSQVAASLSALTTSICSAATPGVSAALGSIAPILALQSVFVRSPPLILLLCLVGFSSTASIGAFPALVPELGRAAGLADWQLGLVAGAFGFARMLADIPVGLFITHHLRRALALSPLLLAAGVLLLGSGGPFVVLLAARAVAGVAQALGVIGGLTAILRYQDTGRLASALNAYELSAMLGVLAATAVLALLPADLPWNLALLLACAPQAVSLVLIPPLMAALPVEPAPRGRPLFARRGAGDAPLTPLAVLAFVSGGAIAVAYATLEQFVIPLRADRDFALGRSGIAGLLMIVQLCDIACLVPAGVLSDRRGVRPVLGSMLVVFGAGTALVAFGSFPFLVAGCLLFGVGMAAWTLPLGVLRGETPPEHIGWRTALYRVGVDGGVFLGPVLSGFLATRAPALVPGLLALLLPVIGITLARWRAR